MQGLFILGRAVYWHFPCISFWKTPFRAQVLKDGERDMKLVIDTDGKGSASQRTALLAKAFLNTGGNWVTSLFRLCANSEMLLFCHAPDWRRRVQYSALGFFFFLPFDTHICTMPNESVKVKPSNPASPVPGRCRVQ